MSEKGMTLLGNVEAEEVSIVDRGKNPHARTILRKQDTKPAPAATAGKTERVGMAKTIMKWLGVGAAEVADPAPGNHPPGSPEPITKSNDQEETMNPTEKQDAAVTKGAEADATKAPGADLEARITKMAADLAAVQQENAALKAQITKGEEEVSYRKGLPVSLRKGFDDLDAEKRAEFMKRYPVASGAAASDPVAVALARAASETEALRKQVESLESASQRSALVEKLSKHDGLVKSGRLDEVVTDYLAIAKHDKAAADRMLEREKALATQVTKGAMFAVLGSAGSVTETSGYGKIRKRAEAIAQASGGKTSVEQAMVQAAREMPEAAQGAIEG